MIIHIAIDDGQSLGTIVKVEFTQTTSDVDKGNLHSLAQCMLQSDAVQNLAWSGTPSISGITIDTTETIYPV